jgi:hypothetical protein
VNLKQSNDDELAVLIDAYYLKYLDLVNSKRNYLNRLLIDCLHHIPYRDFSLALLSYLDCYCHQDINTIN